MKHSNQNCIFDYGANPFSMNLRQETIKNNTFRTVLWTGTHLQVTLMCIAPNQDIGLEIHPHLDQFLYIECGQGMVMMGTEKNCLHYKCPISCGSGIVIPANTWHNLVNTGCTPLKLFSIYAPPQHPFGTVHCTKADAEAEEH